MVFCLTSARSKQRHFVSNFGTRNESTLFRSAVNPETSSMQIIMQNIHAFARVVRKCQIKKFFFENFKKLCQKRQKQLFLWMLS